jgi:hypothetical protein
MRISLLINKGLQRLPDWKRAGKRENLDFQAVFPKVIHKVFHRKGTSGEKYFFARKDAFSAGQRQFQGQHKSPFWTGLL